MSTSRQHSAAVYERVRELWTAGTTQREIGRRVGISKNTVPGIVRRLGLPKRPQDLRRKPGGWTARKIELAKPKPPEPIGPIGDFPAGDTCRHIAGTVTAQFQCCGHPGYQFCAYHAGKAYVSRGAA